MQRRRGGPVSARHRGDFNHVYLFIGFCVCSAGLGGGDRRAFPRLRLGAAFFYIALYFLPASGRLRTNGFPTGPGSSSSAPRPPETRGGEGASALPASSAEERVGDARGSFLSPVRLGSRLQGRSAAVGTGPHGPVLRPGPSWLWVPAASCPLGWGQGWGRVRAGKRSVCLGQVLCSAPRGNSRGHRLLHPPSWVPSRTELEFSSDTLLPFSSRKLGGGCEPQRTPARGFPGHSPSCVGPSADTALTTACAFNPPPAGPPQSGARRWGVG